MSTSEKLNIDCLVNHFQNTGYKKEKEEIVHKNTEINLQI